MEWILIIWTTSVKLVYFGQPNTVTYKCANFWSIEVVNTTWSIRSRRLLWFSRGRTRGLLWWSIWSVWRSSISVINRRRVSLRLNLKTRRRNRRCELSMF
jgi:hypothetical protein